MAGNFWEGACLSIDHVDAFTNNIVVCIDNTGKQVAANILQVSAIGEPLASSRNVVGGAFAFGLHENRHAEEVVAVPFCKWFEQLQSIASWADAHLHI